MTEAQRKYCLHLLSHFKIEGRPANEMASEGQIGIFFELIFRPHKRLQILCSTQYGKSLFVALACICVACLQNEIIAIIAPTDEKAKIIMRYFIEHLGDHEIFSSQLEKNSKLDRLRMEENKERIIMKKGGGIFMISVQAGNTKKGVEAAMGAGARIVVEDESGLIPDQIESTVFRMIAGKGPDAFYCKIGNPFYRNHFHASTKNPIYFQIFIDYHQAIAEGRYTPEFIEEARKKPMFEILYACIFPGEDSFDSTGYLTLIPESRITIVQYVPQLKFFGRKILGIDPAGEGKDKCTFVLRDRFRMEKIDEMATSNDRQIAERALTFIEEYKLDPKDVIVGAFGTGSDVGKEVAIASKGKYDIYTVMEGNTPKKEEEYNAHFFQRHPDEVEDADAPRAEWVDIFLNIRALMYWRLRNFVFNGGQIVDTAVDNGPFKAELSVIRYKRSLNGNKIQLMNKKEMKTLGIPSPNISDAGALTMLRDLEDLVYQSPEERERIRQEDDAVTPDDRFSAV